MKQRVAVLLVVAAGIEVLSMTWYMGGWPFRRHEKDPQVRMSCDTSRNCDYFVTGMSAPKRMTFDELNQCVDRHIDPASAACPIQ